MQIATMESVSLCLADEKLTALLELESVVRGLPPSHLW